MSRQVDLTTLLARLSWRTDTMNEVSRFPPAEATDCINEGIAQFHSEVIRADGQGFAEAETVFTTVIGQEMYSLPAELLDVVHASVTVDGRERDLNVYDQWDRSALLNTANYYDCGFGYYRIVGDNVSILAVPTAARVVTIRYVATAVKLVAPTNTLDGIDGQEEFAISWAAQRFALKNRDWELNARLIEDQNSQLDRLRALVSNRNRSEPNRVGDRAGRQINRRWARRGNWGCGSP